MTAHTKPRQADRVLAALRAHPNGITPPMFLGPYVYDGGDPILRLSARVLELKGEGHDIKATRERNGVARYRLEAPAMTVEPSGQTALIAEVAA